MTDTTRQVPELPTILWKASILIAGSHGGPDNKWKTHGRLISLWGRPCHQDGDAEIMNFLDFALPWHFYGDLLLPPSLLMVKGTDYNLLSFSQKSQDSHSSNININLNCHHSHSHSVSLSLYFAQMLPHSNTHTHQQPYASNLQNFKLLL